MFDHIWRVYRYRNVLTDESYIGQTIRNVSERAGKGKNYRKGTKFREAIDTYGWDTFEQSILKLCTNQEDADYWEKYFIDKFDSIDNGYNTYVGGGGVCMLDKHQTEESRKRISEKLSGENNPCYGRTGEKHPMFGKHWNQTEEARRKMSENHWDCSGEKNPMYGRTGEKNPMYGRTGELAPMYGKRGELNPNYGTHWWNNGEKDIRAYECPEGFVKGRLYKRNK